MHMLQLTRLLDLGLAYAESRNLALDYSASFLYNLFPVLTKGDDYSVSLVDDGPISEATGLVLGFSPQSGSAACLKRIHLSLLHASKSTCLVSFLSSSWQTEY
jgi:hypothetical protein